MYYFNSPNRFKEAYITQYRKIFSKIKADQASVSSTSRATDSFALRVSPPTTIWDWFMAETLLSSATRGVHNLSTTAVTPRESSYSHAPKAGLTALHTFLAELSNTCMFVFVVGGMALITTMNLSRAWSYRSPLHYARKFSQGRILQPLLEVCATLAIAALSTTVLADIAHYIFSSFLVTGAHAVILSPMFYIGVGLMTTLVANVAVVAFKRNLFPAGCNFGTNKLDARHVGVIKSLCAKSLKADDYALDSLSYLENENIHILALSDAIRILSKLGNSTVYTCTSEELASVIKMKKFLKDPACIRVSDQDLSNVIKLMSERSKSFNQDSPLRLMMELAKTTLTELAAHKSWGAYTKLVPACNTPKAKVGK